MFKTIKRLIFLIVILAGGFIALSIHSGGDMFRLFGNTVKQGTDEISGTADLIKESSDGIKKTARETADAIKKTRANIKETSQKVSAGVKKTGQKMAATAQGIRNATDKAVQMVTETGEKIRNATGSDDNGN